LFCGGNDWEETRATDDKRHQKQSLKRFKSPKSTGTDESINKRPSPFWYITLLGFDVNYVGAWRLDEDPGRVCRGREKED
jgi:hypothetical protein